MAEIQKLVVVILVFIFLGLICEGRHLDILNTGKGRYQPKNGGRFRAEIRDLVASPSFANRRQRKVMSKTFQNIIDNKMRMNSAVNVNNNQQSRGVSNAFQNIQDNKMRMNSAVNVNNNQQSRGAPKAFQNIQDNKMRMNSAVNVNNNQQSRGAPKTFQNIQDNKMRMNSAVNVNNNQQGTGVPKQNAMGTNPSFYNANPRQTQNNNFAPVNNQHLNGQNLRSALQQVSNGLPGNLNLNLLAQILASRAIQNNQQRNFNIPNLGNTNTGQQLPNNNNQINASPQNNRINIKITRKKSVPFPSLINQKVNGFAAKPVRSNINSKTPVITMVPKGQYKSNIAKSIIENKRLTMVEKLRSIPKLSLSEIKAAASKTLHKAVTNQRQASAKGFNLDTTNKINIIAKNNTAEVKIINSKPAGTVTGMDKPNFIVLKDISITNTSTEGSNGTVNGTQMSITLMSQATGGRPIVIKANSNIVLSQEKMANGTVQFIIKTDTKTTTPGTTTVPSTTMPTEEPDTEEPTTTPMPDTTAEL